MEHHDWRSVELDESSRIDFQADSSSDDGRSFLACLSTIDPSFPCQTQSPDPTIHRILPSTRAFITLIVCLFSLFAHFIHAPACSCQWCRYIARDDPSNRDFGTGRIRDGKSSDAHSRPHGRSGLACRGEEATARRESRVLAGDQGCRGPVRIYRSGDEHLEGFLGSGEKDSAGGSGQQGYIECVSTFLSVTLDADEIVESQGKPRTSFLETLVRRTTAMYAIMDERNIKPKPSSNESATTNKQKMQAVSRGSTAWSSSPETDLWQYWEQRFGSGPFSLNTFIGRTW